MKQAAKIRKGIYRTALSKCIPAAVPAVFSCKVCSSLERQCSYPSELQRHYSQGPVCYDTHRVLKFNPVSWIHPWTPAEVSGNVEESCTAQILQGRQEALVRSPQTPLCAWPERSSLSHCSTPPLPLHVWVLLFSTCPSLHPKPAVFLWRLLAFASVLTIACVC